MQTSKKRGKLVTKDGKKKTVGEYSYSIGQWRCQGFGMGGGLKFSGKILRAKNYFVVCMQFLAHSRIIFQSTPPQKNIYLNGFAQLLRPGQGTVPVAT